MYHVMSRGDRRKRIFLGGLHWQAARAKAERIVTEEVQRRGWQEQDLVSRRKHDPAKLEIAARLRRQTTLSLREIGALVHFGTSKTANSNGKRGR
jgi:hypothetical protein